MDTTHLLDSEEAGAILRMPPRRLIRLARQGIAPCVALPDGELRFRAADLLEWAGQFTRPGTQEGVADAE